MGKTGLYHDAEPIVLTTATGALTRAASGKLHVRKDNLAASAAPGVSNDAAAGYEVGSTWLDATGGNYYVCKDPTQGAAVWLATVQSPVSPGGSDTQIQYNSSGSFAGSSGLTWSSNTLGVTGAQTITSGAIATVPLSITGASGQTANLQEWKKSDGTTMAYIDASGNIVMNGSLGIGKMYITRGHDSYSFGGLNGGYLQVYGVNAGGQYTLLYGLGGNKMTAPAAAVPLTVQGANGQTAALLNVTSYGGTAGDRFKISASGTTTISCASDFGKPLIIYSGTRALELGGAQRWSGFGIRSPGSDGDYAFLEFCGNTIFGGRGGSTNFVLTTDIRVQTYFTVKTTATPQTYVKYDDSNYYTTSVSSAGAVTFDAVGTSAGFSFSDTVSCPGTAGYASERFGLSASVASAVRGTAIGASAQAISDGTTAVGSGCQCNGTASTLVGALSACNAGPYVSGVGYRQTIIHSFSIGLGYYATSTASNQLIVGSASGPITNVTVHTNSAALALATNTGTYLTVAAANALLSTPLDFATASDKAYYLGDPTTDGTWRIVRSGNNLVMERRESGSYVTKQTITA